MATFGAGVLAVAGLAVGAPASAATPAVVAWGSNGYGESSVPATEIGTGIAAIAAGDRHSLALRSDGRVVQWGASTVVRTPVPAGAQSGVVGIAAGRDFSVAVRADGHLVAWGKLSSKIYVDPSQSRMTAVAAGDAFFMALKDDGLIRTWGDNAYGQTNVPSAIQLQTVAIAAGKYHGLALTSAGAVVAWGSNSRGQTQVPTEAQSGVIAIAGGGYHSLALTSAHAVVAWGLNDDGQSTVPAAARSGVVAIAAGEYHSLALKSDGTIVAWGRNDAGQASVPAGANSGAVGIAAGGSHSLAVTGVPAPKATATASPAPNAAGWNNSPVTVTYTCSSGAIVTTCTGTRTVSAETSYGIAVGTAKDSLGRGATTMHVVRVDLTAPTVSISGPVRGATYAYGTIPPATCQATDALSGIDGTCTITQVWSGPGTYGYYTITYLARATDKAGNVGGAVVTVNMYEDDIWG